MNNAEMFGCHEDALGPTPYGVSIPPGRGGILLTLLFYFVCTTSTTSTSTTSARRPRTSKSTGTSLYFASARPPSAPESQSSDLCRFGPQPLRILHILFPASGFGARAVINFSEISRNIRRSVRFARPQKTR